MQCASVLEIYWIFSMKYSCQFLALCDTPYNNNNQAFYSQASWGRLEMKPHEPKKQE
jgi:hypothetical protein